MLRIKNYITLMYKDIFKMNNINIVQVILNNEEFVSFNNKLL